MEKYIKSIINSYNSDFKLSRMGYDVDDILYMVPAIVRYFELRGYDILYDAHYFKSKVSINICKKGSSTQIGRIKISPISIGFLVNTDGYDDFMQTSGSDIMGSYKDNDVSIYYDKDGIRGNILDSTIFDSDDPVDKVEELSDYIRRSKGRSR